MGAVQSSTFLLHLFNVWRVGGFIYLHWGLLFLVFLFGFIVVLQNYFSLNFFYPIL